MIKPPRRRQAAPGDFTIDDFTVDDQAGSINCPTGQVTALGRPDAGGARLAQFQALCRGCPLRQRCTTSKTGRVLSVHRRTGTCAYADLPGCSAQARSSADS